MIRLFTTLYLISLIFCSNIISQPEWVNKTPSGYLNDYFVGKGTSTSSKSEASQRAFEDAIISIMRNNTITINYSEKDIILSEQKSKNDDVQLEIVRKSAQELRINGESKLIKNLKEVETYYETNGNKYEAWVLVNLPKKDPISPPNAFSPVWRSFLLPGWGQLYKEETFKGVSFMVLSLGGIAGGFIFNELSKDAVNKANSSRTQIRRDFFNNEAKNYNTYSTIGFITAGVFYIWSLVDAIIYKQKDLYVSIYPSANELYVNVSLILK